jgi:aspartate carbamoyltransferase regulatory subunit
MPIDKVVNLAPNTTVSVVDDMEDMTEIEVVLPDD